MRVPADRMTTRTFLGGCVRPWRAERLEARALLSSASGSAHAVGDLARVTLARIVQEPALVSETRRGGGQLSVAVGRWCCELAGGGAEHDLRIISRDRARVRAGRRRAVAPGIRVVIASDAAEVSAERGSVAGG